MKCEICNKICKSSAGLGIHVGKFHNIQPKDYYDKYLKDDVSEGICNNKTCNNKTTFWSIKVGYYKFCSPKCMANDESIKNKRKITCISKYGVDNPSKDENIKEKIKDVMFEKYGVDNPMKSEVIQNKFREKSLVKYGVDWPSKSDIVKEKVKKTNNKNFGVDYPIQSPVVLKRTQKYFREKFGTDSPFESDIVKEKIKNTNLFRYGVENPFSSEEIQSKIKLTNLEKYGVENPAQSEKVKRKLKGKNHHNWKGGVSFELYPEEFNSELRESIKQRDNHTCQNPDCWHTTKHMSLTVHHIDYNKQNCSKKNLITLCRSCNIRANYNKEFWLFFYIKIIGDKGE